MTGLFGGLLLSYTSSVSAGEALIEYPDSGHTIEFSLGSTPQGQVELVQQGEDADLPEIPTWMILVQREGMSSQILHQNLPCAELKGPATIDVDSDGYELIFFTCVWVVPETIETTIYVFDPHSPSPALVHVRYDQDVTAVATAERSDNYESPERARERAALDKLKSTLGLESKEDYERDKDNPRFVFERWWEDHPFQVKTQLTIRQHAGPPVCAGDWSSPTNLTATAQSDGIEFKALYGRGLLAYDTRSDMHYVLVGFQPWVSIRHLRAVGPIVIAVIEDQVSFIDTRSFRIESYTLPDRSIESLEIAPQVLIDGKPVGIGPAF